MNIKQIFAKINIKNKPFSNSELILFFERLSLYIVSGLTLDKTLLVICEGLKEKQKFSIDNIRTGIMSGNLLSEMFRKHLKTSDTISGLVENGENSGRLAEALNYAKQLMEQENELRKKCMSAMAYPIIIGIFAGILTIGLMRGVMPQIVPMLRGLHVELPLLTKIVIALSDGFLLYGLYLFILIIIIPILFFYFYRKNLLFKMFIQKILLRIPITGNLVYIYSLSIFQLSCGSLIESGLGSATSYKKVVQTLSFMPLRYALEREFVSISNGVPISQIMKNIKKIPLFIPSLMSAGEMSGTLGKVMLRSAEILNKDIEHSLKRITSLIEPIMMVGMGLVVGSIALSIMMPIYSISRVLQH